MGVEAIAIAGVEPFRATFSRDERGSSTQLTCAGGYRVLTVHNYKRATLRGLHFQKPGKNKIVVCTYGIVYDVLVDLREDSATCMQWAAFHLRPGDALSIPPGLAHGYLTLTTLASLTYLLEGTTSDNEGIRWDDPALDIKWPLQPKIVSERDRAWRLL